MSVSLWTDHLLATSESSLISCRIISLLGTELLSERGTGTLDVDLASLPEGMYVAIVQAGDERGVRKILVAH
jgi:hypothetical protein